MKYLSSIENSTVSNDYVNVSFYYMARKYFNSISRVNRRRIGDILMMKKIVSGELQVPDLLQEVRNNVPNFNLRSFATFHLPLRRTNATKNSSLITMLRTFNVLRTVDVFHCANIKLQLKKHFFMQ